MLHVTAVLDLAEEPLEFRLGEQLRQLVLLPRLAQPELLARLLANVEELVVAESATASESYEMGDEG